MIGLDFNERTVKFVELKETPQGLSLERYQISPVTKKTDQDLVSAISDAIYRTFSENGIVENDVFTVISGPMVQVRRFSLPPMPEAELRQAVKWEAQNFATFPTTDAVIDYYLIEKTASQETRKVDVIAVAVEKETLKKHISIIEKAGLRCAGITLPPFALKDVVMTCPSFAKGELIALLDIEPEKAELSLFKNEILQFIREINLGGQLHNEILSSFTYYREHFLEEKVGRIYLAGEISQPVEMEATLSANLGIPVEIMNPICNLKIGPKVDAAKLEQDMPRLALAIGTAVNRARDLNLVKTKKEGPKTDLAKFFESFSIPNTAVVGFLVLVLGPLFGLNFYLSRSIDTIKKELDVKSLRLEQLARFQERKLAYEEIKGKTTKVRNTLGQIAQLLPRGNALIYLSLDSKKKQVTLTGETASPQSVSAFVKNLDRSAEFSAVRLKEIRKAGKATTFSIDFQVNQ
jgi:type IV pilus assembly protein PilM